MFHLSLLGSRASRRTWRHPAETLGTSRKQGYNKPNGCSATGALAPGHDQLPTYLQRQGRISSFRIASVWPRNEFGTPSTRLKNFIPITSKASPSSITWTAWSRLALQFKMYQAGMHLDYCIVFCCWTTKLTFHFYCQKSTRNLIFSKKYQPCFSCLFSNTKDTMSVKNKDSDQHISCEV
jgi:hypothetical protein